MQLYKRGGLRALAMFVESELMGDFDQRRMTTTHFFERGRAGQRGRANKEPAPNDESKKAVDLSYLYQSVDYI